MAFDEDYCPNNNHDEHGYSYFPNGKKYVLKYDKQRNMTYYIITQDVEEVIEEKNIQIRNNWHNISIIVSKEIKC